MDNMTNTEAYERTLKCLEKGKKGVVAVLSGTRCDAHGRWHVHAPWGLDRASDPPAPGW